MLGVLSRRYSKALCVAGTHGKTTTSGMIAQVLLEGGFDPSAFIGGKVKALGGSVGSSLVEEDKIDVAREIIEMARMREVNLVLPVDSLVANSFSNEADVKVVDSGKIEDGWQGLDIGPDSINMFKTQIEDEDGEITLNP